MLFGTSSSPFHDFYPQPELTVENLPSFLLLGKALLLLFVGEEEDKIGRRQNQALVKEMRTVVESGRETMERYLACWIHLYVSVSAYLLLRFSIMYTIQNPHFFFVNAVHVILTIIIYFVSVDALQLVCPSWGHT